MSVKSSFLIASLLSSVAATCPTKAPENLHGTGRIVGNDLEPNNVQAYFEDDPRLTAVTLSFSPSDIHWQGYDAWERLCSDYQVYSKGNGRYRLVCRGRRTEDDISFDMRVSSDGASMTLAWFDLLILHLVRR